MNAKLLYVATLVLSLVSSLAFAGEPQTPTPAPEARQTRAATTEPALVGPQRDRGYNPGGAESVRLSEFTRAEVRAQTLAARRNGTLRRTDYD